MMDELIGRHWKGTSSKAEERALCQWREASERNERYYRELIHMLELAVAAERDGRALPPPCATDLIELAEFDQQETIGAHRFLPKKRWRVALLATAAAILVLGVTEVLRRSAPPRIWLGAGEFATGASETATVRLGDGTVVRIAPASRIRVGDAQGTRDVFLEGKAYFAVAPMEKFPFRVRTPVGEVVALGTRFEVMAEDDLRVVVTQGRVALARGQNRVEVRAGEMSVMTHDAPSQPVKVETARILAWVGQFLAFQSTPLRRVATELEQQYGTRVVVTDSALAELTITGTYTDRSFEEVVTIICGVVTAQCSIRDGVATIGRSSNPWEEQ